MFSSQLIEAACDGDLKRVRFLLDRGAAAAIDHLCKYGRSALHWAASNGHQEIVRLLLDSGAKIDYPDIIGDTALVWAAYEGKLEMVRLLLERGAAIDHQNKNGDTALIWAAYKGHLATVRLLLERGAAIDLPEKMGNTALCWADRRGHMKVVEVIEEQIQEQQTYAKRKKEIELFFLGKPLEKKNAVSPSRPERLFSSVIAIFSKKKQPAFFLPNVLVEIIEDYAKPTSTSSQLRKT